MLKRTITALLAVSMTFGIIAFAESDSGNIPFDFAKENYGFVSIFADYPAGDTVDEFYELAHSWENIPNPAIFCIFQLLHAYSTGFVIKFNIFKQCICFFIKKYRIIAPAISIYHIPISCQSSS